jgi:hypothetical protein
MILPKRTRRENVPECRSERSRGRTTRHIATREDLFAQDGGFGTTAGPKSESATSRSFDFIGGCRSDSQAPKLKGTALGKNLISQCLLRPSHVRSADARHQAACCRRPDM